MKSRFVQVHCNVECVQRGIIEPKYRVYVNNELFTERTWIFTEKEYLEEMLQIDAPPGKYTIKFELVNPRAAHIIVSKFRVGKGHAKVNQDGILEILL